MIALPVQRSVVYKEVCALLVSAMRKALGQELGGTQEEARSFLKSTFLKRPSLAVRDVVLPVLPSCSSSLGSSKPGVPGGPRTCASRPLQRAPTLPQLPPLVSGDMAPHHLTPSPGGLLVFPLPFSVLSPHRPPYTV